MAEEYLVVRIDHILLYCSSVDRHLGYSLLVIVKKCMVMKTELKSDLKEKKSFCYHVQYCVRATTY